MSFRSEIARAVGDLAAMGIHTGADLIEGVKGAARHANEVPVATRISEADLFERTAGMLSGGLAQTEKIAPTSGMTMEYFDHLGFYKTPVKISQLDSTAVFATDEKLLEHRRVGQTGAYHPFKDHNQEIIIKHDDGTFAPYKTHELVPQNLDPGPAPGRLPTGGPNESVNLKIGDHLFEYTQARGLQTGALRGRIWAESVDNTGASLTVSGTHLFNRVHGLSIEGSSKNPLFANVGDILSLPEDFRTSQAGRYRVTDIDWFSRAVPGSLNQDALKINHALNERMIGRSSDPTIPIFRPSPSLDVRPGDQLAIPKHAPQPREYPGVFSTLKGHVWNVGATSKHGVILQNGDHLYAVPREHVSEPYMYKLPDRLKQTEIADYLGQY